VMKGQHLVQISSRQHIGVENPEDIFFCYPVSVCKNGSGTAEETFLLGKSHLQTVAVPFDESPYSLAMGMKIDQDLADAIFASQAEPDLQHWSALNGQKALRGVVGDRAEP